MREAELGRLVLSSRDREWPAKASDSSLLLLELVEPLSSNLQLGPLEGTLVRKRQHTKVHGSLQSHTDTAVFMAFRVASCIEEMQATTPRNRTSRPHA